MNIPHCLRDSLDRGGILEIGTNNPDIIMGKIIYAGIVSVFLFGGYIASAETVGLTEAQIEAVIDLVESFGVDASVVKNVEASLRGQSTAAVASGEGKDFLKLKAFLKKGEESEDVRILQKILASDPALYPEGLVTGFFGPLTELAVKRLQAKLKIEQEGAVDAETLARINEILASAGVVGDVPADLLNTRVKIEIKIENGKEEVKIEVKCDSSGSGNDCKDDDEDDDDEEDEDDNDEDDDDDEEEDEHDD